MLTRLPIVAENALLGITRDEFDKPERSPGVDSDLVLRPSTGKVDRGG